MSKIYFFLHLFIFLVAYLIFPWSKEKTVALELYVLKVSDLNSLTAISLKIKH